MSAFVEIRNLQVTFGINPVIYNLNLRINNGEICSVIGPSGCGKSTLLKSICGIVKPTKGEIQINDSSLNTRLHNIGYIPQHYGLADWLKVKDNIAISERIRQIPSFEKESIIRELGIEDLQERYPRSLSGGQRQRVALARAWAIQPDLLLMDEPFAALDSFAAETSKKLFIDLWKKQKTTTVFVTHNIREAVQLGKKIVILSGCPAEVLQVVENPLFEKGASRTEDDYYALEKEIKELVQQLWRVKE